MHFWRIKQTIEDTSRLIYGTLRFSYIPIKYKKKKNTLPKIIYKYTSNIKKKSDMFLPVYSNAYFWHYPCKVYETKKNLMYFEYVFSKYNILFLYGLN